MPRKLKTFVTSLGFFDLAVAAPSMKAALEAWGMRHNAFQRGTAAETDDPAIVAAATAKPGIVLKRAVGSHDAFAEDAALPDTLPASAPRAQIKTAPRRKAARNTRSHPAPAAPEAKAQQAQIISFRKAQAKRARERAAEEKRLAAERAQRRRALDKAQAALDDARQAHEAAMAALEDERDALDRRVDKERQRWDNEQRKLSAAMDKAER